MKAKGFLSKILNCEMEATYEKGLFYEDDDLSFEETLLIGKEKTLFIFEMLAFLLIDHYQKNFFIAAFVVYFISKVSFDLLIYKYL